MENTKLLGLGLIVTEARDPKPEQSSHIALKS